MSWNLRPQPPKFQPVRSSMGLNRRKQTGKISRHDISLPHSSCAFHFVCFTIRFLRPLEAALVMKEMISIKSYKVMNLDKSRLKYYYLSSSKLQRFK